MTGKLKVEEGDRVIMSRVILALDVIDEKTAMKIAEETAPYLHAIKVGWPLVMNAGMDVVRKLSQLKPVICDFKVADIPNTTRLIVRGAKEYGAYGIIVHTFVGHDSLEAAVNEADDMKVYAVTEMSHPGALDFMQPHTEKMVKIAMKYGVTGIIAPATRPSRLREIRKIAGNLEILSPGVGTQGGKAREAIENGADYIIVGRSIYKEDNPKEAAKKLYEETKYV